MNTYKVTVTDGPGLGRTLEVEAETATDARKAVQAQHPDSRVGTALRQGPIPGVPARRAGNSRYSLKDTGKMPDVDPGLASNRRGSRR